MNYAYVPGYYVPQGPREHPSANTALILGLVGNFCLSAVTGVPAILIGRNVLRSIEREPLRWRGAGTAKFAIVLGWISVFETAFVTAVIFGHGYLSGVLGILFGLVGVALVVIISTGAVPSLHSFRKARLAIGVPFSGILCGSIFGLAGAFGADAATAKACENARATYPVSLKKEDFAAARENVAAIQRNCRSSDDAAAMGRDIDSKAVLVSKRKEQEAKDLQTKLAADKEKRAVETFPTKSKDIATSLKSAQSMAWSAKWEESESELDAAQSTLDDFNGTSIEQSKDYTGLSKQIATQRKVIQPQIDAIKAKRAQQALAAAVLTATRGERPTNSAWDGSISCIEAYLKTVMNDPDSYQHVGTTAATSEGEYWVATSTFRGKNAFGALIVNSKKFYIQQGQVVKVE